MAWATGRVVHATTRPIQGAVTVSVAEIIGLVFAIGFVLLIGLLAVPILRLGATLDQATRTLSELTDRTGPLLANVATTIDNVNVTLVDVHGQLGKVDTMTSHLQQITTNVTSLTSLFAATIGSPLVRVAAFTYGVRQAIGVRRTADTQRRVRQTIKTDRKAARDERRAARHRKEV